MARKLIIFFLPVILLSSACSHDTKRNKNVFYWNIADGFSSMDPAFAKTQSNIWLVNQVFNTLIEPDDSLHLQPSLAKNWEISPDGIRYTFHLRSDVFFQDDPVFNNGKGRKMTASDVVYSLNRIRDPKTASPGAWIFNGKIDSLEAPDDSTFVIRLKKPFRPFLQLLSLKYCSVVPHEAIEKYGKDFRSYVVGTGPFRLKYYFEGEKIVLQRNPAYFEKDASGMRLPYLDAVVVSFNPSKQNEFFSFARGELSMMSGLDPSFKDNLLTRDGTLKDQFRGKFRFQTIPFLNTEFIGILMDSSLNKTPLMYKKVRQALNYAIDRSKMVRYLKNNTVDPGNYGFVPPSLLPATRKYYNYDPVKAKQLLKEAGIPAGATLSLSTTSNYLDLAVYIQKELENIGLTVNIDNVPGSTLSDMKTQGKTPFFRSSWIADYADPENFLSIFYSKNRAPAGPNYYHFSNAAFDSLYLAALSEPDENMRMELYRKMQDIVMNEAPVIVLYYDKVIRLTANGISGLSENAMNLIDLKRVKTK